jgi:serpin B
MKKFILSILITIFMFFGTSCMGNTDQKFILKPAGAKYSYNYTDIKDEGYINFINKLESFYAKLSANTYTTFKDETDNMCISPVSIYMALALTIECSDNNTRQEILNAIGVTYEEVKQYTKLIYSQLNNEYLVDGTVSCIELLTNSIWFEESIELKEIGLTSLADNYNCSSYGVPFKNNNGTANKALQDYVNKNTKGLINNSFNLPVDTLLALVNTFYLKEVWDIEDDLVFTKEKYNFTNYDKTTKETKLLQGYYYPGQVYKTDMFEHFYTKTAHGYKVSFIVPSDEYSVDDIYTKDTLQEILSMEDYKSKDEDAKKEYVTRCLFPEFEASFKQDIKDILKDQMGIKELFSDDCNFTNITDEEDICCGKVVHQTKLMVDKTGMEGAAVTIVVMSPTSADPGEYEKVSQDFIIDRDFVFVIGDNNGNIVFTGVIKNI